MFHRVGVPVAVVALAAGGTALLCFVPPAGALSQLGRTATPGSTFLFEGAAHAEYTIRGKSNARQTLSVRMLRDGVQQGRITRLRLVRGARYPTKGKPYYSIRYIERPCLLGERATWVVQVRLSAATPRGVVTTAWKRGPGVRFAC